MGQRKNEETKEQTAHFVIRAKKSLIQKHAKNEKKKAMYLMNDNVKKSNIQIFNNQQMHLTPGLGNNELDKLTVPKSDNKKSSGMSLSNSHVPNFNTPVIPPSRETKYIDDSEIADELVKKSDRSTNKHHIRLSHFHRNIEDFGVGRPKINSEVFDKDVITDVTKRYNTVMDRPPVPITKKYYTPPKLQIKSYEMHYNESDGSLEFPSIFCPEG